MSKIRLAINGFGRIGRATFRILIGHPGIEVVAINDLANTATLAHLLKYDTVHRQLKHNITFTENELVVDGVSTLVLTEKEPQNLPGTPSAAAVPDRQFPRCALGAGSRG